ncbi:MAG TPA: 50S ribosomal protein L17 [Phycisphaerae bacterium]|nr:50S ribosomal protein L17 [Phycisphaerae bacterium]HOI54041.1 50S ribosomal protein L17 [Phycisphaerae bacterium]
MRHCKQGRKLNRTPAHRLALMRSLAAALFEHEAIITTRPKAKEVQRFAERLITVAKRGQNGGSKLASRRLVASRLQDEQVAKKLCEEIAPRFAGRAGGYTRILKLARPRKGDAGVRVRLELSEIKAKKAEKEEPKKK